MPRDEDAEQREIETLLTALDGPVPRVDPEMLATVARQRMAARPRRWGRWAAGFLLMAGLAGVAYAIPGSPVRRLVQRVLGEATTDAGGAPDVQSTDVAGIALDPGNRFSIVFPHPPEHAQARVTLSDSTQVMVNVPGSTPSFTSERGRLVIDLGQIAVPAEIMIPRSAPHIEILAGDLRIFLAEQGRIISESAPGPDGSYLLPLGTSQPAQ